jgi:hypothetical protein
LINGEDAMAASVHGRVRCTSTSCSMTALLAAGAAAERRRESTIPATLVLVEQARHHPTRISAIAKREPRHTHDVRLVAASCIT